jgi:hypothetical protein
VIKLAARVGPFAAITGAAERLEAIGEPVSDNPPVNAGAAGLVVAERGFTPLTSVAVNVINGEIFGAATAGAGGAVMGQDRRLQVGAVLAHSL